MTALHGDVVLFSLFSWERRLCVCISNDYNRIQVCFQLFMQVVEGVALKMENSGLHLLNSKLHADARVARIGREALDLVAGPFSAGLKIGFCYRMLLHVPVLPVAMAKAWYV